MIRSLLILLGILILVVLAMAGTHDAGQASLNWMHYRIDTSAAAVLILIGFLALCAVIFWNVALWLSRSPQRAEKARAVARRKQGDEAITRGFMALASGDGKEARRLAIKAIDLCDNTVLVRILGALAAQESGDATATRAAYSAMLSLPDLKLAGLKGLMELAQRDGDKAEALRLATEAYSQPRPTMWAFRALFEARLEAGDWREALSLLDGALNRKLISPIYCERAKAALMAASAARMEADGEDIDQALDYAVRAAKLQPQFTPGPVIAARLLLKANRLGRAEDVLEAAWSAQPHPAIWLAYRDLVSDETPRERARRLQGLIDRNPKHRESLILHLERALLTGSKPDMSAAMTDLAPEAADDRLTRRLGGLMARGAQGQGDMDAARTWLAAATLSKGEPDWSDMDAEGRAFAYGASDWSRLILTFAETAALAHPRFERGEKGLPEMPDIASRYMPSMPFIKAAGRSSAARGGGVPLPDDPGAFDAALSGQDLDGEPDIKARPARASRRKAAPQDLKAGKSKT
ncbi:heme biosynthesis HemY N-terminal domain-containing protein [Asticcacaulis sp. EMRT-3]|uniref:heme biosynthesis protein HemY n=1 Tax=Asticcacaulis sp. EMRT-3 TaxID=3040349 RepID=UPI0024AF551E|nr:heme biosynthesis HemY N-terminal domain-containing protein [Asticcacaulis sp. EMRT-3]MDI7776155.1 heme biosynthesis HemY N-terminal domain-containing protein [Asticcacaulis sp. EMRT-3]